eukprot:TRINITY_DN23365_c0_g1_i1.p1 TRINITY_DN23365_c0_g1~~TRINITY_DN23365_c0_g1_i1.p1  ORF type:complete len:147 (-),score=9.18 TRINITY_DN23365_c0_g1_i1:111-551(-)
MYPYTSPVDVTVEDESIAIAEKEGNNNYVRGIQSGTTTVYVQALENPEFVDQAPVVVMDEFLDGDYTFESATETVGEFFVNTNNEFHTLSSGGFVDADFMFASDDITGMKIDEYDDGNKRLEMHFDGARNNSSFGSVYLRILIILT